MFNLMRELHIKRMADKTERMRYETELISSYDEVAKSSIELVKDLQPILEIFPQHMPSDPYVLLYGGRLQVTVLCKNIKDIQPLLAMVEELHCCIRTHDDESGRYFYYSKFVIVALVDWDESTCRLITTTESVPQAPRETVSQKIVCDG